MSSVRVRFAPSPTGHLHIGGLRTAFFNWLFAKHHNGTFLIRVEDTDLERSKPEYLESILQAFKWANLQSDEPIVIQSQRFQEHAQVIEQLLKQGKAYRCYCTPDELLTRCTQSGFDDQFGKYDGKCRELKEQKNIPFAVRFKVPRDKNHIQFDDLILGEISFETEQIDDFIIARSDGRPMYNFVVVVDDAFMKISHIIRASEHIINTPKQLLLYQACNFPVPRFAHVPLILGPSGDKLSKRDAATSVLEYKAMGYLPDALLNYLVRLGWSSGDQEIFTRQELVEKFDLKDIGKKGSIFDIQKLNWVNGVYIRSLNPSEIVGYITQEMDPVFEQKLSKWNSSAIEYAVPLYQERVSTLKELAEQLIQLHDGPKEYNKEDIQKWITKDTPAYLQHFITLFAGLSDFDHEHIEPEVKKMSKALNIKLSAIAQPIRIALIGSSSGPGIYELMTLLGKQTTVERLQTFHQYCLSIITSLLS